MCMNAMYVMYVYLLACLLARLLICLCPWFFLLLSFVFIHCLSLLKRLKMNQLKQVIYPMKPWLSGNGWDGDQCEAMPNARISSVNLPANSCTKEIPNDLQSFMARMTQIAKEGAWHLAVEVIALIQTTNQRLCKIRERKTQVIFFLILW